ncbi:hypothetical protein SCHPADRAFT_933959 [Schizopora paradoxa]|uniref:F-box domain-containing protein n=1 Tax=Schizopora paradoxa TaxID=27342 RepID=A0A0H2QYG9_9AGAM|nr:hypothetical protein SCHPADRAFT_933959 [Schizopora paradoxa]
MWLQVELPLSSPLHLKDVTMNSSTHSAKQMVASALEYFSNSNELGEQIEPSEDFTWFINELDNKKLKKDLLIVQAAENLLRQMLASAGAAAANIHYMIIDNRNRREFSALPDDVLAIILEMAAGDLRDYSEQMKTVKNFSSVSRRFRRITLGLPSLWSYICSPSINVETARLFASRATTPVIALSISGISSISPFYTDPESKGVSERARVQAMFEIAASVSSRLQTMHLHFSKRDISLIPRISQVCSALSFPFLAELSMECYGGFHICREFKSLCSDWNMPSLQKLVLVDIPLQLPDNVLSRIKVCSIEANRERTPNDLLGEGYWRTAEIVAFLLSLRLVEKLRVAARLMDHYRISENEHEELSMDSVRNLTVGLQNLDVAMGFNILRLIKFPFLTSFKLDVGLDSLNSLEEALKNVRFRVQPTTVKDLTVAVNIAFEDRDGRMPLFVIGEWCEKFGDLKRLTMESERDKAHGLFAFAGSFDSIQLVDPKEDTTVCGDFLADIPLMWGNASFDKHPHRAAVITVDDLCKFPVVKHDQAVKYVESDDNSISR